MKFKQLGIRVTDLTKSKDFYLNVLGFKVTQEIVRPTATLVFLEAHGIVVELIYSEANQKRTLGPVDHIAFYVDNLAEKIEELKSFGIALDGDVRQVGGGKMAFFFGPDGERFEYFEVK